MMIGMKGVISDIKRVQSSLFHCHIPFDIRLSNDVGYVLFLIFTFTKLNKLTSSSPSSIQVIDAECQTSFHKMCLSIQGNFIASRAAIVSVGLVLFPYFG